MDRVDVLVERASRILNSATLPVVGADDEVAMDFLAERDDFMALLEENASFIVGRSSLGPGDVDFEQAMVNLMDAVQSRFDPAWLVDRSAEVGLRPNSATA